MRGAGTVGSGSTGLAEHASAASVLRDTVLGQRRDVAVGTVLASLHQAGEALVPVLIGVIIDRAVQTGSVASLLGWLGVLAAVFAVLSTSYRLGARAAERAAEMAGHALRLRLAARLLDARGGGESGRLSGELVTIATSDARRVGAFNLTVPFGLSAVVGLVVSAVTLLRISVPLGLLVVVGLPLVLAAIRLIAIPLERRTKDGQRRAAHAAGVATDLVRGLRVLKGIGGERAAATRYRRTSQQARQAAVRAAWLQGGHDGVLVALTGAFIALLALVGGRLAAAGGITVGELVAVSGLALFLGGPLGTFGWINAELAQARASAARIAEVLAAPPVVRSGVRAAPEPVRGEVVLRGLSRGALGSVAPAGPLELSVAPGELVGIVTAVPAAAAELVACLAREADPVRGVVELDGVPLTEMAPAATRAVLLVAAHEAALFDGTVLENVVAAAGARGVDGAADPVTAALWAAAADDVANALRAGVHTGTGEGGQALSGGQRQRVALARALAADPPVLVLHDPTTAVDAVTEARIADAVRELRRGRTTIIVATSPALLAVTDRVVFLDGSAPCTGRHAELVADVADYRATVLA